MEKRNNTGMIIGLAVAVVAVIGIVWAVNMGGDDMAAQNSQTEQQTQQTEQPQQSQEPDIVELASDTASLSTLVSAVQAAELVETLQGEGPFTVFAPTNQAFDALPDGTLDSLLQPENQEQLQAILTYHVVSGEIVAADLSDGQTITTVEGSQLTVHVEDGNVLLEDETGSRTQVITPDVTASNGVVHIIDGVLLLE